MDSRIMIPIFVDIREPLEIVPRRLFLGLIENGMELNRGITVRSRDGSALNIHTLSSRVPFIVPHARRVSASVWRIDLSLEREKLRAGDFRGLLDVSTDFPAMEHFTIGLYGRVRLSEAE